MNAQILDGKRLAAEVRAQTREKAAAFTGRTGTAPGLATVLVGDDPASHVYVASKRKMAAAAGIADFHHHLPGPAPEREIAAVLDDLAADPRVSGILLQLPLPAGKDSASLIERIPAGKDVDGLTTTSAGLLSRAAPGLRPCTPSGVIALLDAAGIDLPGKHVAVVGRSQLVGAPLAQMLLHRNATVTVAHSRTADLAAVTREADIVVAAAGREGLITAKHVREGAVVVDVGIHRTPDGLAGDVQFDEVAARASWITPVPGGVGPMTIAMLLANTLQAAAGLG
ncbi:bifunctional methylenetetrahydrofolate dehydrogenase/methenyltetrahydrofolate cyclohydrolase FolD [Amycolatopsis jejuensis]|uniref:bifunctional methylenetetrahydrofolate dehydrogenase/methenyltetrahydrofolate cyclohydrolase FolD n=1 Tax=Amycolatopsis jejuensis TaxID=330084 RepID=UPI0005255CEF|nr:bifunctional methylenetetrahydrofolate dehydrogenase/methenyltetrahydrofolate cyclohydrolase FolD [Amycolatopsis jejuensis]